ncbi:MAG: bifunctional diaminohydroxyphosphoribosylaminopyrimidine deaminase/5-amino-6-(5-phosphoribosylamino)uracil reductase RibD [Verrucomicrobia bacterium]|nr:bifunctional diaminohydroxyphosphoribosylaminopyrimidine deaminase/5-amino-6-(5-phosphoribosylamino)uracil reductase RibD [Verrucomicrobiota bacterium]
MKISSIEDEKWMKKAICLARKGEGATRPNPPVGAVLVRDGRCVGNGHHKRAGGPHAEIFAIRRAGQRANGATLYVTLEPCCTWGRTPPCTDAIVSAGIARVVAATSDPNPRHNCKGLKVLRAAGLAVKTGVLRREALELIAPFEQLVSKGRPFVVLKMAMTLDGRIADRRMNSRWISGPASRKEVHKLRARSDAVIVGSETALVDDPSLLYEGARAGNLRRVVVDSSGKLPLSAKMLNDGRGRQTIIATTRRCTPAKIREYEARGAMVLVLPSSRGMVSLPGLLRSLGRMGMLRILCEGGGRLAAAMVQARLVDEYVFFVAPRFLGSPGPTPVLGGRNWLLGKEPRLRFVSCEKVGDDVMIRAMKL